MFLQDGFKYMSVMTFRAETVVPVWVFGHFHLKGWTDPFATYN